MFIGRVSPEKGIVEAIEIAELSGRHLKVAAKIGTTPDEQSYNDDVFQPALKKAGPPPSSSVRSRGTSETPSSRRPTQS